MGRQCRRAAERRNRERRSAATAAAEESHPDPPSLDQWLVERGLAEQRDGELVATGLGRELGPAIFDW
jgi:hypothetical protein